MNRDHLTFVAAVATASLLAPVPAAADTDAKKPPYIGSIAASRARMRTGPGRNFPASWIYVRADLPVRVLEAFKEWRRVEDPDGTQGWMLNALLSSRRTAIVRGTEPAELRDRPGGPTIVWRVQPGVVGRVTRCGNGWCRFDVKGQAGFIQTDRVWGVAPTEELP
ncbi:MAG: SH3 domain-containing protein [Sphingomonas phyllosphaerae]